MVIRLEGVVLVQMNSAYMKLFISIALHRIPDDL